MIVSEGLAGQEKEAAKDRMVLALGGVPERGPVINYKLLKVGFHKDRRLSLDCYIFANCV